MADFKLVASRRLVLGKRVKRLRDQGLLPAVIYGPGREALPLEIRTQDFITIYDRAGTSSLVDLKIDDLPPAKVLMHEPDRDSLSGRPIHVDLFSVKMTEKIKTEIPLRFIGVSEAVEGLDGTLITNLTELEVECLPTDLAPEIEVDLSKLKTFDDQILIRDIALPKGIELTDSDPELAVAIVNPPKTDEELEAELSEPIEDEPPEVELSEKRGKEEDLESSTTAVPKETADEERPAETEAKLKPED